MATEAATNIELGLTRNEFGETRRAVLVLRTDKHSFKKGMKSDAYVWWICGTGKQHAFGLASGTGDYEKELQFTQLARVTQKAIEAQHAEVFTSEIVESLINQAKNWYATADLRAAEREARLAANTVRNLGPEMSNA